VDAHHWLILHGRYICQARSPKCGQCAVADCCDYAAQQAKKSPAKVQPA
jgi:endonuclease III